MHRRNFLRRAGLGIPLLAVPPKALCTTAAAPPAAARRAEMVSDLAVHMRVARHLGMSLEDWRRYTSGMPPDVVNEIIAQAEVAMRLPTPVPNYWGHWPESFTSQSPYVLWVFDKTGREVSARRMSYRQLADGRHEVIAAQGDVSEWCAVGPPAEAWMKWEGEDWRRLKLPPKLEGRMEIRRRMAERDYLIRAFNRVAAAGDLVTQVCPAREIPFLVQDRGDAGKYDAFINGWAGIAEVRSRPLLGREGLEVVFIEVERERVIDFPRKRASGGDLRRVDLWLRSGGYRPGQQVGVKQWTPPLNEPHRYNLAFFVRDGHLVEDEASLREA